MRNLAPTPECISRTEISGGYQLCSRCGNVLIEGEGAFVVPRISSWLIYTHEVGPNCRPKAVNGWKAVRYAEAIRGTDNVQTFRDAGFLRVAESLRSCVSLLDDKHIEAETELGDYEPSRKAISNGDDLRAKKRIKALDTFNTVEDAVIAAIDQNILDQNLEALLECMWSCRQKSYAPEPSKSPPCDEK
jgi:hypothetical protein